MARKALICGGGARTKLPSLITGSMRMAATRETSMVYVNRSAISCRVSATLTP